MREFVQLPINARLIAISSIFCDGSSAMYSNARSNDLRSLSSLASDNSGTLSEILTDIPGEVPQVTNGSKSSALISTVLSKLAPSSVGRVRQYSTAFSQFSPFGANGLPFKY